MEKTLVFNNLDDLRNGIQLSINKYRENLLKEFYAQITEFTESDGTIRHIKFNQGSEDSFCGWVVQDGKWGEMKERIKELESEVESLKEILINDDYES